MIVSNTTPFIAFARIRQPPSLERATGEVTIPEAVARELSDYGAECPGGIDLALGKRVDPRQVGGDPTLARCRFGHGAEPPIPTRRAILGCTGQLDAAKRERPTTDAETRGWV